MSIPSSMSAEIRPARAIDAAAIAAIEQDCLRAGDGSLQDEADPAGLLAQYRAQLRDGLPFLIASDARDGTPFGFAHASRYLPAEGFAHCVRTAIWLRPEHRGHGLGWALLRDLLVTCREAGLRQAIAHVRADSEAALALHADLGFTTLCHLREACQVGGRLHDVVVLRRLLDRMRAASAGTVIRPPGRFPGNPGLSIGAA